MNDLSCYHVDLSVINVGAECNCEVVNPETHHSKTPTMMMSRRRTAAPHMVRQRSFCQYDKNRGVRTVDCEDMQDKTLKGKRGNILTNSYHYETFPDDKYKIIFFCITNFLKLNVWICTHINTFPENNSENWIKPAQNVILSYFLFLITL